MTGAAGTRGGAGHAPGSRRRPRRGGVAYRAAPRDRRAAGRARARRDRGQRSPGVSTRTRRRTALGNERARAVLAGSVIDTYFRGELATLRSIASSPPVVQRSTQPAMQRYFERLQPARATSPFSAGLGWIDVNGFAVVSTQAARALAHEPLRSLVLLERHGDGQARIVSEAVTSRLDARARDRDRRADARCARAPDGRAGRRRCCSQPLAITRGALDLAGPASSILDRDGPLRSWAGRAAAQSRARARAARHRRRRRHARPGRLERPRRSPTARRRSPAGRSSIDEPRSTLLADARRGFFLELALIAAAASIVLFLIALHARCAGAARRSASAPRAPAARPHAHPRRRIARQRGLGRPRRRSRTTPSRRRSASSRSRPRITTASSLSASADGAVPVEPGRARARRRAGRDARLRRAARAIVIGEEPTLRATLPGRAPGAARSRALVLCDAAREPQRQPAGRALPALRAHAPARRRASRRRSPGTRSRRRRRSTARRRSSASTRSPCACSAACSRIACPRSRASS